MGFFYTRPTNVAALALPRLTDAYAARAQIQQDADTHARTNAEQIEAATRPRFSPPRFLCALVLVVVLFFLYYWSAHDPEMKAYSDGLYHLFKIMTSGLATLFVGEVLGYLRLI